MYPGLDVPVIVAVLAGLGIGALCGFINGSLIAVFRIAPFIATLGMFTAARGAALIYSDGRPISKLDPSFNWIGQGDILGIPVPIFLLIVVACRRAHHADADAFRPVRVRHRRQRAGRARLGHCDIPGEDRDLHDLRASSRASAG